MITEWSKVPSARLGDAISNCPRSEKDCSDAEES
jgi:hypothetical protein